MPKPIPLILKLVISAGLLVFVFSDVPISQLSSTLREVSPWPFLASLALIPCMVYLAATQTKVLTERQGLTLTVLSDISSHVRDGFLRPHPTGRPRWWRSPLVQVQPTRQEARASAGGDHLRQTDEHVGARSHRTDLLGIGRARAAERTLWGRLGRRATRFVRRLSSVFPAAARGSTRSAADAAVLDSQNSSKRSWRSSCAPRRDFKGFAASPF